MIAVDTNILVRLLVQDDPIQANKAEQLFANHPVFIADTVILETEWVLRHAYKLAAADRHSGLNALLGLDTVFVRDQRAIQQALDWFQNGMNFADAWHLALSQHCEQFASFDQKLIKKAYDLSQGLVFKPS
ncbi:Predicted nucleic-acid-binding protein, contains PIN domain [Thiothrix eikelboomii]|uniref:Predicted nucleic-acid-binding protein, contains PIN domain n=1 Tax=Thiothrix eikelboomii TaxID=92487 RepID=A0A1T4XT32_9GAMM|nr:type II toxin-antitoxin system VapC family toxin [Thiothrix eikelboomii]SKA92697.1 Predicted nucleic-acid-binding protein, contains PIN domain [Thiothrix eikelboomii]